VKYVWRNATRVPSETSAQDVGRELEVIRKDNGGMLRPEDVVKRAKSKKSCLYGLFEWNDAEAGHQHRLLQARYIIKSVKVVFEPSRPPVTKYVNVRQVPISESYYQDIRIVVRDEDEFDLAMQAALSKLMSAQQAVEELRECAKRHKKKEEKQIGLALNGVATATEKIRAIQAPVAPSN